MIYMACVYLAVRGMTVYIWYMRSIYANCVSSQLLYTLWLIYPASTPVTTLSLSSRNPISPSADILDLKELIVYLIKWP